MRRKILSMSLAGAILLTGAPAVLAQDASADTDTGTNTGSDQDDDGFPWGLLGLAGLAGLAGLKRDNRDDHRDTGTNR